MHLLNGFSFNMLHPTVLEGAHHILMREIPLQEAQETAQRAGCCLVSAVDHADMAGVFEALLGVPVSMSRQKLSLASGVWALVGQYSGPRLRLPKGATVLPEGCAVKWILIKIDRRIE